MSSIPMHPDYPMTADGETVHTPADLDLLLVMRWQILRPVREVRGANGERLNARQLTRDALLTFYGEEMFARIWKDP